MALILLEKLGPLLSLSARRAWIEIVAPGTSVFRGWVALRKESVDRNKIGIAAIDSVIVALRKESVDRNSLDAKADSATKWSLSARRAWIEIPALLGNSQNDGSLSARRAWIEIQPTIQTPKTKNVALRKESVDRNWP